MRNLGPVVWLGAHGLFALPRFEEVRSALSAWELFSSASGVAVDEQTNANFDRSILSSDPPAHTEIRRPFAEQLSSVALRPDAPGIRAAAGRYAELVASSDSFDGVGDVAKPFSLEVVCDAVGIPEHCREHLPELAEKAFNTMGPAGDRLVEGLDALRQLGEHAESLVASGELIPGGRGAELVEESGTARSIVIYTWPGIDTTVNGMSAALLLFAQHPDQWDLVRNDASLIPSAFNEILRMHAPVHYFTRVLTGPTEVGGATLLAGSRVALMYGSANRDERRYANPDVFDVTRNPRDQLAFGRGVHVCVGSHLAKLEGHSLLEALAERVQRFEFDGEPAWMENAVLHGLSELPLRAIPV